MTRNRADAEDLVQNAMLKAYGEFKNGQRKQLQAGKSASSATLDQRLPPRSGAVRSELQSGQITNWPRPPIGSAFWGAAPAEVEWLGSVARQRNHRSTPRVASLSADDCVLRRCLWLPLQGDVATWTSPSGR